MNEIEKQILKNQLVIMRNLYFDSKDDIINQQLLKRRVETEILLNPIKEQPINEQTKDGLCTLSEQEKQSGN